MANVVIACVELIILKSWTLLSFALLYAPHEVRLHSVMSKEKDKLFLGHYSRLHYTMLRMKLGCTR